MYYKSIEQLFDDFKKGEIEYIDAIQILQDQFDYNSLDAEELVSSWES